MRSVRSLRSESSQDRRMFTAERKRSFCHSPLPPYSLPACRFPVQIQAHLGYLAPDEGFKMQADVRPLTVLTEGGGSDKPAPIDSRPTRAEAYAAAAIYERLLHKHGLAALYTVEVEHIGYLEWAIYLIPH